MKQTDGEQILKFSSSFGETLEGIRQDRGMTQEELAMEAELSLSLIRDYEAGNRLPGFNSILKLSCALDVSCTFLMTADHPPITHLMLCHWRNRYNEGRSKSCKA